MGVEIAWNQKNHEIHAICVKAVAELVVSEPRHRGTVSTASSRVWIALLAFGLCLMGGLEVEYLIQRNPDQAVNLQVLYASAGLALLWPGF